MPIAHQVKRWLPKCVNDTLVNCHTVKLTKCVAATKFNSNTAEQSHCVTINQ
jgi:hypothetical protein